MNKARLRQSLFAVLAFFLSSLALSAQLISLPGLAEPEFPPGIAAGIESVREEGWDPRGLQYIRVVRFTLRGEPESETFFNPDGSPGSRVLYQYDAQGRLARKEFHHPDARVPDTETYLWDSLGRLQSVARAYTTGMYGWRFEYTYDEQGRIILATKIDRYWKDVVVWRKTFTYNGEGLLVSTSGGGLDENIRWRDDYRYDAQGRLSEQLKYDVSGTLISHTFFGRDHRGRINREWQETPGGEKQDELHYYYRDDPAGIWREKHLGRSSVTDGSRYFLPASWYLRSYTYRS